MLVLNKSLTINQDWNHYNNTLLVKYKDIITGNVKAQKTTTRRTVITVNHKCRCNMQVGNAYQLLRDSNTFNLLDRRTFGEVFKYFFLGGESIHFFPSYKIQQNENIMEDPRVSISISRTDSAGGEIMPTYFLPDINKFHMA